MATGIKAIISNLLPSLYKNVKKTDVKNPLDFGYNPSYLYKPKPKKTMTIPNLLGREQLNEGTQPDYEEPDYQELINKAAQYNISAGAEGWFMRDLEQNKHEDAIAISLSTFEFEEKSKEDVLSDINETIENIKAIESAKQQEDPTGEDVGANPLEEEMPKVYRKGSQEGGEIINEQMGELMPEEETIPLEIEEEPIETMLPDEEMEGNYVDFIIDEALDEEEEQYLLDRLSGDDQLSMIFDKVVETASEFAGSGLVEGPGSAVSDSIPARLSDGEFVMTSKAANQIGPDNLQGLMEVAETEADQEEERRTEQAGGYVQEEDVEEEAVQPIVSEKVLPTGRILPESEVSKRAKANADILNPRMSLFAS